MSEVVSEAALPGAEPKMPEKATFMEPQAECEDKEGDIVGPNEKEKSGALPPLVSLRCQLCSEYMKAPVTLPCLHSFCKDCLYTYSGRNIVDGVVQEEQVEVYDDDAGHANADGENDPSQVNAAGDGPESGAEKPPKKEKPFCCPTCRDTLAQGDSLYFTEPFLNDRIARIIRLLQESKILCQNCESTASEFRCSVCDAYTCQACWDQTHTAPIFHAHIPERLTHIEMTCLPKCEQHPANDVEYFCPDDEIGVCQVCLLKGEFKGKEYSQTQDVKSQRQTDIEQGVSDILLQRAELLDAKKSTDATLKALLDNLESQKQKVQENFATIRETLHARETETLDALQALYDAKRKILNQQIADIDTVNRRIEDGVKNINLVLNYSNPLELVYLTYVLQDEVSSLCDIPSTSPLGSTSDSPNHEPAVDEELPVVLSDKVVDLIKAYASVPDASLVAKVASGETSPSAISTASGTKEQQRLLEQVAGKSVDGADYGCTLQ